MVGSPRLMVCKVSNPWGLLCGDDHEMFIRKSIIDRGVLALKDTHEEIISNNIFGPRVVLNL